MSMLKVEGLNVYYGSIHAIKGVSFEVNQGEIVTMIGANGAGKSTTMNTVAGLLKPKSGSITFEGHDVTTTPANKVVSLGLALCPEGRRVFQQMSVRENLEMGGYTRPAGELAASLDQVFEQFPRLKERQRQIAGTLSGGEAQRVKLATELSKRSTGRTIYILDEPTTGLHTDDVKKLLEVLQRLVDAGNTVLVIEHNLDVIKCADHLIDLGPEGGDGGGTIVCTGTPEEVAACERSYTGRYLKKMLER